MKVDLKENEVVIKAGDSTQIQHSEKVKGKLILTNQRIYFKPIINSNNGFNLEILFNQIKEIIYFSSGIFLSKGIRLVTRSGNEIQFTMKDRDKWGMMINKMY